MIVVLVEKDQDDKIDRIVVKGHAGYAAHGYDIVCSAVSAVTIGLVNAMEKMFSVQVHQEDDGNGNVECAVPQGIDLQTSRDIRLLMEAMQCCLEEIVQQYPEFVKIKKTRKG